MDKKETINVFLIGSLFVMSYHYFGSLWFLMAAHMMWNYLQDFVFGLPDSGRPAAVSFLNTTVLGSSFFYDKDFGIEGSGMAAVMSILGCLLIILIGRKMERKS
jgi:membrane protease YdiL (CAAX protease family)